MASEEKETLRRKIARARGRAEGALFVFGTVSAVFAVERWAGVREGTMPAWAHATVAGLSLLLWRLVAALPP